VLAFFEAQAASLLGTLITAVLALDRAGDVDPAQLLDVMIQHTVAKQVVPGVGEEPERGGNVGTDGGAFGPRCAFPGTPCHLFLHLRGHLIQWDIADALLLGHTTPPNRLWRTSTLATIESGKRLPIGTL